MKLPANTNSVVIGSNEFQGYEVPDTGVAALDHLNAECVFRAKKNYKDNGELYLWGERELYSLWDDKPQYYDLLD